ncbi:MAG TPA: DUF4402 domain-containing protein [Panacibacter sp.]|nr:DUF4402 domain-containing protein [Panacibacter sp.]HNP42666.1 DUF4402 domain-containing protein [Panacibacter sp.]
MRKSISIIAAVLAITAISSKTYAQETASATATATIVTPISITKTVDMNFGNIAVQSSNGGTVVLGVNGSRSATGGVTLPAVTGTVTAASFTINGEGSYSYTITIPSANHTISDGTHTMTVNAFVSNPSGTGTLTSGTQTLNVGATLNIAASQAAGTYVSSVPFDVTVNYN